MLFQATLALAEPIVIVRPEEQSSEFRELFVRLKGELMMQGYEPTVIVAEPETSVSSMRDAAIRASAKVCLSIEASGDQALVRLVFVDASLDSSDEVILTSPIEDDTSHVLPLRTIESLRNGLYERRASADAPEKQRQTAPEKRSEIPPRDGRPKNRFVIRVTLGPSWGNVERPPLVSAGGSLGVKLHDKLTLAAEASLPITMMELRSEHATARYRMYRVGGELRWQQPVIDQLLTLEALLGLGATYVAASATTDGSLLGREPSIWSTTASLGAGAWYSLGSQVSVGGLLRASLMMPKVIVEVDRKRGGMGHPAVEAQLGATWAF